MKKLVRYHDGSEYITGDIASIEPNGVDPVEEYDLSLLTTEEVKDLKKNKKDKNLLKKAKKI